MTKFGSAWIRPYNDKWHLFQLHTKKPACGAVTDTAMDAGPLEEPPEDEDICPDCWSFLQETPGKKEAYDPGVMGVVVQVSDDQGTAHIRMRARFFRRNGYKCRQHRRVIRVANLRIPVIVLVVYEKGKDPSRK